MNKSKETYLIYKEGNDVPIGEYRKKPGSQEQIYFTPFASVLLHAANVLSVDVENKKVAVCPEIFLSQTVGFEK